MIALEDIKTHLRIDHADEDAYLTSLGEAAVESFNNTTGRYLQPEGTDLSGEAEGHNKISLTAGIKMGCLMMVGHWYENRESTSDRTVKEVPMSAQYLFAPYKWHSV